MNPLSVTNVRQKVTNNIAKDLVKDNKNTAIQWNKVDNKEYMLKKVNKNLREGDQDFPELEMRLLGWRMSRAIINVKGRKWRQSAPSVAYQCISKL